MSLTSLLKKSMRSKNFIILLLIFFVVYVILNFFLFKWVGHSSDSLSLKSNDPNDDEYAKLNYEKEFFEKNQKAIPKQIALIKQRISGLESQLEKSKQNALELTNLIKRVHSELGNDNEKINQIENDGQIRRNKSTIEMPTVKPIAVLVFACNRPDAIEDHLRQLIQKRAAYGNAEKFPIIVSQDCGHSDTANSIKKFSSSLHASLQNPDQSEIANDKSGKTIQPHLRGYFKISRHYKWALEKVLIEFGFDSVIITEDDLNIADDFFEYFDSMHKILEKDTSLFCVSAWNDNGKQNLIDISKNGLVHRSDFFPGLGWMMLRTFWLELREKWPEAFWDDWIRDKNQRKDRACLRPEISRTEMSAKSARNGVSLGQFFDNYLKLIILNTIPFKWSSNDNSFLIKNNYDPVFLDNVYKKATEYKYQEYLNESNNLKNRSILITYGDKTDFVTYAKYFGIMDDFKDGVPRTSYRGVVRIHFQTNDIYLAPLKKQYWKGYDSTW